MTRPDFEKHRLDQLDLAISFSRKLSTGDGLSSIDEVIVTQRSGAGWSDASTQFHTSTGGLATAINGDDVEFTLGEASTGNQDGGSYFVRAKVSTANGETLNAVKKLDVDEQADTAAITT